MQNPIGDGPVDHDLPAAELEKRLARVRDTLARAGLDAAIVSSQANFTYLTGYSTPSWANVARPMAVLVEPNRCTAVVSRAEAERMLEQPGALDVIAYTDPAPSRTAGGELFLDFGAALADRIAAHLDGRRIERLGAELSGVPGGLAYAATRRVAERCGAELLDAAALFATLRRAKSPHELSCLSAAALAADAAYSELADSLRIGMTERDVRDELAACVARSPAEELRLLTVVVGAANPLAGPATDRVWREGELLMIDLGLTVRGYWADLSRHFVAGAATPAQTDGYGRLLEAFAAGRSAARAGVRASDVAAALGGALPQVDGRETGRLGHAIGLEITEAPSLALADVTTLPQGATLCLEPHAWFDGAGYMIGEEMVALTHLGLEMLSPPFPAELLAVTRT